MQEKKQLRVGLFEEDLHWLVLLQTLLTRAGHSVCRQRGEGLRAWLAVCSVPPGSPGQLPYDLLLVNVAGGELLADEVVSAHLEQIVCLRTPPLIVLTAGTLLDFFVLKAPAPVAVLPLRDASQLVALFQLIEQLTGVPSPLSLPFLVEAQQSFGEPLREAVAADQAWLDRRWTWLERWMAEPGIQTACAAGAGGEPAPGSAPPSGALAAARAKGLRSAETAAFSPGAVVQLPLAQLGAPAPLQAMSASRIPATQHLKDLDITHP